jgi:hypothetical protein
MNNPPAFPALNEVGLEKAYGMTLRDYFAAKAMQATINAWDSQGGDRAACIASIIAEESYELADAMLKAREA